jgi:mono/diheme cytochrome c family protein
MGKFKIGRFWTIILTLLVVYAALKWGVPAVSREITGLPFPMPVPGTLMVFFMVLTVVALFLFVTFSDENMEEFLAPVRRFLRGEFGKIPRAVVLVAIPAVLAWQVYEGTVPKAELPVSLRIQHPSSNFPKKFESLKNPFSSPSDAQVAEFVAQVEADEVAFIPQVRADVERWWDEHSDEPMIGFIPTEPVIKLLAEIGAGEVKAETARAALMEKYLFEGRALYAMNCRACHGDSVSGDGPMADGFKLRPLNFTDNGTIETIVEGYTFWRVMNGGVGLPTEATPWDSAMPEWKLNLTEAERWMIILAEYDLAEKTPRIPEGH